jgi:hypothetical protein
MARGGLLVNSGSASYGTTHVTFGSFIKIIGQSAAHQYYAARGMSTSAWQAYYGNSTNDILLLEWNGGGYAAFGKTLSGKLTIGQWYHVIYSVTYAGGGSLYLDGVPQTGLGHTAAALTSVEPLDLIINSRHNATGQFEGYQAELFVTGDRITDDQAKALAKGFNPLQVLRRNNLLHYFPLNSPTGVVERDLVRGYDMTNRDDSGKYAHPRVIRQKASRSFSGWRKSVAASTRIFPVSDITDGGWTDQAGGSNITDAIDEIDASNYAVSSYAPVNDPVRFQFPSAVGAALPFKVAYAIYAEGTTRVSTTVNLYSAGILIATWLHPYTGMALEVFEQYLTSTQFAAITDLADLEGELIANENDDPISIFGRDNIVSWYDAQSGKVYKDDGATVAAVVEDDVKYWKDMLQPHRNVRNPTGSAPFYDPVGINGYPAVEFHIGDFLKTPTTVGPVNSPSVSTYVVHTAELLQTSGGRAYLFGYYSDPINGGRYGGTNYPDFGISTGQWPSANAFGVPWGGMAFVNGWYADGDRAYHDYNGRLVDPAGYDYIPPSYFPAVFGSSEQVIHLGHSEAEGDWINSKVGEIVIAKGAPTTANQRERLYTYFRNKWNLPRDPYGIFGSDLVVWTHAMAGVDPNGSGALANNFDTVYVWKNAWNDGWEVVQATETNRPIWRQRVFNGKFPGIVFDGTDNFLAGTNRAFSGNSLACFAVGQIDLATTDDYGRIISLAGNTGLDHNSSDGFAICLHGTVGARNILGAHNGLVNNATKEVINNSPCVFGIEISPNLINVYVDNEVGASDTTANTPAFDNSNTLRFGSSTGSTEFFGGILSEVVMLKRLPTTNERAELHEYFRQKWKLHNPKHIMGNDLAGWWDARYGTYNATTGTTYVGSGSPIKGWEDRSGNGNKLTDANGAPWFSSNFGLRDQHPSLVFDPLSNTKLAASLSNLSGSEAAAFVVAELTANGISPYGRLVSVWGASTDYTDVDGFTLNQFSSTEAWMSSHNDVNQSLDAKYDFPTVVGMTVKTNENILYRHNVRSIDLTATPLTLDSSQSIRIGQDQNNDAKLAGKIGEIILTKKVPTVWQRRQLTQYLENRWGTYGHPKLMFGSDLIAWYDAYNGVYEDDPPTDTAESGDDVFFWYDLSGNPNHLTGSASHRPVYNTAAGLIAKPGVVFTAANEDFLKSGATLDIAGNALTVLVVGQFSSSSGPDARLLGIINSGGSDYNAVDGVCLNRYGNNAGIQFFHQNSGPRYEPGAMIYNKPYMFGGMVSGTAVLIQANERKTYGGTGTAAFADNSTLRLGCDLTDASAFLDGVIYEVLVIKRAITIPEEIRIRDYLRNKWDF